MLRTSLRLVIILALRDLVAMSKTLYLPILLKTSKGHLFADLVELECSLKNRQRGLVGT